MKLYLVRHAAAIVRSEKVAEENRYLTIRGRKYFRMTARRMAKKKEIPDVILTSPLARALQTAEILSEALSFEGEVAVSPALSPGFDAAGLRRILASFKKARGVAIVGHEPDFGEVAGKLLNLERPFPFKKGMIICLKIPSGKKKGKASLKWVLFEGKKIKVSTLGIKEKQGQSKPPKK